MAAGRTSTFSVAGFSHEGLRGGNEDRWGVFSGPSGRGMLAVVADGMGGHAGGELAAETVVETAASVWKGWVGAGTDKAGRGGVGTDRAGADGAGRDAAEDFLRRLILECHEAVNRAGEAQGIVPRATVAALLVQMGDEGRDGEGRGGQSGVECVSVHAGDCRVTQYGEGGAVAQSIDHSLVQIHVLRGKITQAEAAEHPDKNRVLMNVGGEVTPEAEITRWDTGKGGRFVVCSDGFWEVFEDEDVLRLFEVGGDAATPEAKRGAREKAMGEMFAEKIRGREKQDNTTAVMVEMNSEGRGTPDQRPPTGSAAGYALASPTPPQGGSDSGAAAKVSGRRKADTKTSSLRWLPLRGGTISQKSRKTARTAAIVGFVFLVLVLLTWGALAAGQEVETSTETGAVGPLESLDLEVHIEAADDEDIVDEVSNLLRAGGSIGSADSLAVSRRGEIGDSRVIRLQQTHGGIAIPAGQVVVIEKDGVITHITGKAAADIDIDIAPALTYADAVAALDRAMEESLGLSEEAGELIIFTAEDGYHLAWRGHIEIDGETQELIIDAHNAALLARYPVLLRLRRRVVDFAAACNEAGITAPIGFLDSMLLELQAQERFVHTEDSRRSGIPHVDGTYRLLGEIHAFMRDVLGIDSIDGRGAPLKAVAGVRFYGGYTWPQCVGEEFGALWNSWSQSAYLPGSALEYSEVVAHELAHGIIDNGSGLVYEGKSGALNEAISDAFGVGFRAWQRAGGDIGHSPPEFSAFAGLWELRQPGGTIRNLRQPKLVHPFYPDHYDGFVRGGDVHLNSSIINQAFYILSEGGRHPRLGSTRRGGTAGARVQGIGIEAAVRIYAQAGAGLLTPRSDFRDARYAFARAAELMYGGKHSDAWVAVHQAMDAVGLPGSWRRPRSSASAAVPSPAPASPTATPVTTAANPPDIRLWLYLILSALILAAMLRVLMRMRPGQRMKQAAYAPAAALRPAPSPVPAAANAHRGAPAVGALVAVNGGSTLPLTKALLTSKDGLVIGRSPRLSNIVIKDGRVSRRHLRLRLLGGDLFVEDLNSTQGTSVAGEAIAPLVATKIQQGDVLKIAAAEYRLQAPQLSSGSGP